MIRDKIGNGEKMKFTFKINEKDQAIRCYNDMSNFNRTKLFGKFGNFVNIFYIKDEAVLVKYGDIAAEKWYAEEEKRKKDKQERIAKQDQELSFRKNKPENIDQNERDKHERRDVQERSERTYDASKGNESKGDRYKK